MLCVHALPGTKLFLKKEQCRKEEDYGRYQQINKTAG